MAHHGIRADMLTEHRALLLVRTFTHLAGIQEQLTCHPSALQARLLRRPVLRGTG
jgi:hypothetical protein